MDFIVQFYTIIYIIAVSSHSTYSKEIKTRCQQDRVHNMVAYSCADMKLNEIPKNLKSNTEVIDASENRIRKLTADSFNNYRDLKFIYLFNNKIIRIDVGTFSRLDRLEVLDLSENGLRHVPAELIELPNLRRLYLAENDLMNEGFDSMERPIRAPLEILNIAYNDLERIPAFGIMPLLETLNVSGNPLSSIAPEQFAPFCVLKHVDTNKTEFGSCTCHDINNFVEEEMHLSPILLCKGNFNNCNKADKNTTRLMKNFITCTNEVREELLVNVRPNKIFFDVPKMSWPIPVVFAAISFLLFSMLFAHCMQKPRQTNQQTSTTITETTPPQITRNVHINQMSYEMEQPFRVNPGSRSTLIW